jgi:mannose-1-phosphate guanylyltransferase/phosphomannomutase
MRALSLAAGEGTRLRPLTFDRPKPMLPIGGRPILEHLVELLRHHGVTELAINLHYKPEVITRHFGNGSRFGVSITYSFEDRLLGSAGAAKQLEGFFSGETFVVLYGDVLASVDITALARVHREHGGVGTLALYEVEDPSRCGIVELSRNERIRRFVEKPALGTVEGNLANAGIYVLEPDILQAIPEGQPFDFGSDVFPSLLELGHPLYGVRTDGYVLDIGAPERYLQAEVDFQAGRLGLNGTAAFNVNSTWAQQTRVAFGDTFCVE